MGNLYVGTGGNAGYSGSTDSNTPTLSGVAATVAGSVVTLPAGTDLTLVDATAGSATQSTIYLADATNSNMKVFWITAKADSGGATPNVTVSVAPTGVVSSAWAIGGRNTVIDTLLSVCRAGDTCNVNAGTYSIAGTVATFRIAGDATSGPVKLKGVAGVRPVLNTTNTSTCVSSAVAASWVENIEVDQDGASGSGISLAGSGSVAFNVKVSDAGGTGIAVSQTHCSVIACEVTGTGGDGINSTQGTGYYYGNYVHDVTGDGIEITANGPTVTILHNIIDTPTGRGILFSGTAGTGPSFIIGNTVYGAGNSGIEMTGAHKVMLFGNILMNNGNAAGESNAEWTVASAELAGLHGYNVLYNGSGADAPINFTVNGSIPASEFTTDPGFTNAAGANFAFANTSPAYGVGFPTTWLGASTTGFMSIGPFQLANSGGGGGGLLSSKPMAGNFQG